mgnify:FL=1
MAGILTFAQFVGGADQLVLKQDFPSSSRSLIYDFDQDVTSWTFTADYQVLVVDTVAYNTYTGEPNFSSSKVIGYFPKYEVSGSDAPSVTDTTNGLVKYNLPANMYAGGLVPDARKNVPIAVVSNTWTTDDSPTQIASHRWAIIQNWEPDVAISDPTADASYTAFSV